MLHLCSNLLHPTLCRDLRMSPLATLIEDAATELLISRIKISVLLYTMRLGLGALARTRTWGRGQEEKGRKSGKQAGAAGDLRASWP